MFKTALAGIVLFVVLIGTLVALDAAGLQWYAPWRANKVTEVTRNTNQYQTTQVEAILAANQRYLDPSATEAQKLAAIDDMCRAANRIDDQYVPSAVKGPMRQRGCWNGS